MRWFLMAALLLASSAHADITRRMKTSSRFMGASEGTSVQYYQADRHASESATRWTEGLMKTMSGGKTVESTEIVRLDKEVIWRLDPRKKTYSEMTFAEFRHMIKKTMSEMEEARDDAPADTTPEDMYEWTTEDKSEPEPKTINGWSCRNVHVEAVGVNKADPQDKVILMFNTWNSEGVAGAEEIRAFQERYAKAIGLDQLAQTPGLVQAVALYEQQFDKLTQAVKKAPGEAVLSTIEVKRNQLKGPSVGEAMREGAKEELMSKLPFGRKKEPKKDQPPVYELRVKFGVTTELTEAPSGPVQAGKFEIPQGFKLEKKRKN